MKKRSDQFGLRSLQAISSVSGFINPTRKWQLLALLLSLLLSGGAEVASLAAVAPFLSVLTDPDSLLANIQKYIPSLSSYTELLTSSQLIILVTGLFCLFVIIASTVRILNIWLNCKFAALIGADLSKQIYSGILSQSLAAFVSKDSSVYISAVTSQIGQVVAAVNALLQSIYASIIVLGIFIALFIVSPFITLALSASVLLSSAVVVLLARKELKANSHRISSSSIQMIKILKESISLFRQIKLQSTTHLYVQKFSSYDEPQRHLRAKNTFIGYYPRYIQEAIGIVSLSIACCYLIIVNPSTNVISILGIVALGVQKLLPSIQQIYNGWAVLKSSEASIQLADEINSLKREIDEELVSLERKASPISIKFERLQLKNISFRFGENEIFKNLTFEILRGETVGLIGKTGSGKSTLIDLITTLQRPETGKILLNSKALNIDSNPQLVQEWRKSIAIVPQNIELANSSILENIIMSEHQCGFDEEKFDKAVYCACAEFIFNTSQGYKMSIGENGNKLSGGQRQRLVLARALYQDAQLLVLDEATSALDGETQALVISRIKECYQDMTTLMISHRQSTLVNCSRVLRLTPSGLESASV